MFVGFFVGTVRVASDLSIYQQAMAESYFRHQLLQCVTLAVSTRLSGARAT
jgi:hypothetical protein